MMKQAQNVLNKDRSLHKYKIFWTNISIATRNKVTSNSSGRFPNYSGSTVEAEVYFKDSAKKMIVDDRF